MGTWENNTYDTFSFGGMNSQSFPPSDNYNGNYIDNDNDNDNDLMLRFLGGGGEKVTIDYSVFGMTMVTLVFIFTVGIIRHKVEHLTGGNEVFELVLETCYHELSTLGIVEAVIFILHKYYEDLVIATEKVFAEVHFTLFFVVIFNTIMSSLLYVLSCHVANTRWARMEAIDLDHYVAVRKQFEDVNKKLDKLKTDQIEKKATQSKSHIRTVSFHLKDSEVGGSSNNIREDFGEGSETSSSSVGKEDGWAKKFWKQSITRKTVLYRKQRELMVQVRFHDLRVHFIESHKLPPNFRISDYLKLCMNDEFKNLIELTSFSWAILMGVVNAIYFVMGLVYFNTADSNPDSTVGYTLTGVFLGCIILSVPVSYITHMKMNQIYFKFVSEKAWIQAKSEDEDDKDNEERTSYRRLNLIRSISTGNFSTTTLAPPDRVDQKDYFWGGNPSNVVMLGQLMQFGYAISFAVLLVFNSTLKIEMKTGSLYFILAPICCYILFLMLWCIIMPKYTQCTSLGDLVRRKHLVDIDARSKLDKAQTKREEEIDYLAAEKEVEENMRHRTVRRKRQDSSQSNPFARFMGINSNRETENLQEELDQSKSERSLTGSQRLKDLSALVKQPTKNLPDENIARRRRERRRAKSVSDGVAAMRLFSTKSAMAEEALSADPDTELSKGKLEAIPTRLPGSRRPRQKMVSTGVFLMQSEKPPSFFDERGEFNQDGIDREGKIEPMSTIEGNTGLIVDELRTDGPGSNLKGSNTKMKIRDLEPTSKLTAVEENFDRKEHEIEIHHDVSDQDSIISEESIEEWEVSTPEPIVRLSLAEKLRTFILHRRYTLASALFGTMVLLFCLGLRIELILLETCLMKDHLNTWNFLPNRVGAFWIIFFLLLVFIAESSMTSILFGKKGENFNAAIFMAGITDIVLSGVCLSLFLWAEIERCCSCNNGENYSLKAEYSKEDSDSCDSLVPDSLCCPPFGSRLCHGVGSIEPIVGLVALRIFRFKVGHLLVSFHDKLKRMVTKENSEDVEVHSGGNECKRSNTLLSSNSREDGKEIDFNHETGTIAELWILALSQYPEIVNEHGIFSGLVLEAMLGIKPLPDQQHEKKIQDPADDSKKNPHHLLTAESIIKAGKTKMPRSFERGVSALSLRSAGGSSVADLNIEDHNFLRPAAPLIRSMRRCECQWKWLKSSLDAPWEIVDVVLTEFEIVWFDAKVNVTYWDSAEMKKIHNVKEAIIAKKGGKGLRLIDVAAGREISGRLALSDIDRMRLSRIMPSAEKPHSREASSENFLDLEGNQTPMSSRKTISKEYWNDRGDKGNLELPVQKQFERVTEDRLKLHSTQGTLFLRFFVDLYHNVEPTLSGTEIEKKKGALLWCESISHLCGQDQLKQKLPHFGEGRDGELKDFIEITNRVNEDSELHKSKLFQLLSFKNQF